MPTLYNTLLVEEAASVTADWQFLYEVTKQRSYSEELSPTISPEEEAKLDEEWTI